MNRLWWASGSLSVLLAVLLLAGCAGDGGGVVARDWWVRELVPGQEVTAGYGVLVNGTDAVVRVVRVESDCCERVEMHRSVHEDGQVRMLPVAALGLLAGQSLEFVPGGYHLMLYGPRFGGGDAVELRFYLDDGAVLRVSAALRAPGAAPESAAPGHGRHRR